MRNEEKWIVNLTKHAIGKERMSRFQNAHRIGGVVTPGFILDAHKNHIQGYVRTLSPQKLGCVCVMGRGQNPNDKFFDFIQVSNFSELCFTLEPSMSGLELLQETATAVIACIACDIVKQADYRAEEARRDREYAL